MINPYQHNFFDQGHSGIYTYTYSFYLQPEKVYDACYEWRKVLKRNELWAQLPGELIEIIAKQCVVVREPVYQSSGTVNFSRIGNMEWGAQNEEPAREVYEQLRHFGTVDGEFQNGHNGSDSDSEAEDISFGFFWHGVPEV